MYPCIKRFENWILEAREPWKEYKRQGASAEESSSFLVLLQDRLSTCRQPSKSEKSYIWEYEVYALNHSKVKVCKIVYGAILGITSSQIDWAQRRINNNMSSENLVEKAYQEKEKLTLESALKEFGIECDEDYRNHIDLFVNYEKIPASNRALVCVAFLCEFFKLCGDHEVRTCFLSIYFVLIQFIF